MSWKLPTSLIVGGVEYQIRTDYRDILTALAACADPDLPDYAKELAMVIIVYKDYKSIPDKDLAEAATKACEFIDAGNHRLDDSHGAPPRLMDWEQDERLIVPAINRIAGVGDIRSVQYCHWWTFLGYYMEIGECLYSNVLSIREKKNRGKKLEKWEKDFYKEHRDLIDLKKALSEEEKRRLEEEKAELERLFG